MTRPHQLVLHSAAVGEHVSDPRFAAFYGLLVVEWRISERLDARAPGHGRHVAEPARAADAAALQGRPPAHVRPRRRAAALARRRDAAGRPRGGGRPRPARDPARRPPRHLRGADRRRPRGGGARLSRSTSSSSSGSSTTSSTTTRPRCSCASGTACSRATAWPAAPVAHAAEALEARSSAPLRVDVAMRRQLATSARRIAPATYSAAGLPAPT